MKRSVCNINSHGISLILFYFLHILYKIFISLYFIKKKFYVQLIILNYSIRD